MDTYLKLSQEDQRLYCEEAQAKLGLPAPSIEKDYWVCWTLRELFGLQGWGEHLAFKGGTSLSKAWRIIERFSEDIDVVIAREFLGFGGHLGTNQKKKLRAVCKERIHQELLPALDARFKQALPAELPWTLRAATKEEDPDEQTLLFYYPGVLTKQASYVRPLVAIELGARSDTEPSEAGIISPYIYEALPETLGDGQFAVKTVAARRTFLEKAMLLHEEMFRPSDKPRKRPLARHYYDIYRLIQNGEADKAIAETELFASVAEHREQFFNQGWIDYGALSPATIRLLPDADQIATWARDYGEMKKEMFFGDVPTFDEVCRVVGEYERKLNQIKAPA
jgi:hypothetical protein